jgi:hypothetical protein
MAAVLGAGWVSSSDAYFALVVRIVARAEDMTSYYATVVGAPCDARIRKRCSPLSGDLHIKFVDPIPFFPYHDVRLEYTVAIRKESCNPQVFLYKSGGRRRLEDLRALNDEKRMVCLTSRDVMVINVKIPKELEDLEVRGRGRVATSPRKGMLTRVLFSSWR